MIVTKVEFNHFPRLKEEARGRARDVVRMTAVNIWAEARDSMEGPKSGRIYRRSGKEHQASAPGEAPAIDYGLLVNSLQWEMESELTAVIYTNQKQAAWLEFGTPSGRMAARPFMTPAAEKNRQAFIEAMTHIVR